MLQDNPLLAQLKQQLHSQIPRAEGVVKAHEKGYGFLETDNKKSYFISVNQMKKVLDGDKVSGVVIENGDKTAFEPDTLIESALDTFLARVSFANKALEVITQKAPNRPIRSKTNEMIKQKLTENDWVKAKLVDHPLQGKGLGAEIIQFVTHDHDVHAPWLIALAKYHLEANAPIDQDCQLIENIHLPRIDLTDELFYTIDGIHTEDMDDALAISRDSVGNYILQIAIADPSSYIEEYSELDIEASKRCFSTYLPGYTVGMLPESLANKQCSLKAHEKRAAIVCKMSIDPQGAIDYQSVVFNLAWVESKAKLSYENVSAFIEHGEALPVEENISSSLTLLAEFAEARNQWRNNNALLFKDNVEYHFVLNHQRQLVDIVKQVKLVAHKMVEEAMVAANQAFTYRLQSGIFNTHSGFDNKYLDLVIKLLSEAHIEGFDKNRLSSFEGYKALRQLTEQNELLEYRLRRYQSPADFSFTANPHFGLGFDAYATWTSPIRKYGDLVNHRILKAMLAETVPNTLNSQILVNMNERRRATRQAEREVNNKLYCQFLHNKIGKTFAAQIIDLNRGGAKVRLTSNGAVAFLPASLIHPKRNELTISSEEAQIKINDEVKYRLLDQLNVTIHEVKLENSSVIVNIVES